MNDRVVIKISIIDKLHEMFNCKDNEVDLSYFECEDSVEEALTWLDNHPTATLEKYEKWLDERDEAIKKMKNGQ